MSARANCPACGGPVTFTVNTSLVTVCPYCHSAVGRGDRGLESLGKVADLVETDSPLDVGLKGRYEGVPFTLTGRTQFAHPAGGVWDEWYAALSDGRWGWLAEAQGRFYMTFTKPPPDSLPPFDRVNLGQSVEVGDGVSLTVAEKNRAKVAGAVGELPYRLTPGQEHPFADLSGPKGEFATLDYSGDKPAISVGRQVTLDELQIPPSQRRRFPGQEPRIQAVQLNCPHCGGALELRAPDKTERVGCPACGAMSDVKEGKLRLLLSLDPPRVQPLLPLGSTGTYQGVEWTVIGFMQRYVTFEGVDYFWEEYLLYQPRLGFRWLTRSDGHWNWVEAIPTAAVRTAGKHAEYSGHTFALFQRATARVAFVVGEFYWKVTAGEEVESNDYVRAPEMLSEEVTQVGDSGEVNWSHGLYLTTDEVEKMFARTEPLPAPTGIGPNQPYPHSGIYRTAVWLFLIAVAVAILFMVISPRRQVFRESFHLAQLPPGQRSHKVLVDRPLSLRGHQNIEVILKPAPGTSWIHLDGTLTPADPPPQPGDAPRTTNTEKRDFAFAGLSGQSPHVFLTSLPAGDYRLSFDLSWQNPQTAAGCEVIVRQGVPHGGPFVFVVLCLGAVPLVMGVYQVIWEARRWGESNP